MLSVDTVSFSYKNDAVLSKVSFTLERGQHLAVMGESGSGKSTLLKAIYGLLDVPHGTISWNREKLLGPNYHLVPGESFMKYVS